MPLVTQYLQLKYPFSPPSPHFSHGLPPNHPTLAAQTSDIILGCDRGNAKNNHHAGRGCLPLSVSLSHPGPASISWRLISPKAALPGKPSEKHMQDPMLSARAQLVLTRKVSKSADQTNAVRCEDQGPASPPKWINPPLIFFIGGAHLYSSFIDHKILHVPFFS